MQISGLSVSKMDKYIQQKIQKPDHYSPLTFDEINQITNGAQSVILTGPNGCGKSMAMRRVEEYCINNDIECTFYVSKEQDAVAKINPYDHQHYGDDLASAFFSEGERMDYSFERWMDKKALKMLIEHTKPLYLLLDEIDSGLSYDRLKNFFTQISAILKTEKERGKSTTVIASGNSYELIKAFPEAQLIWVPTKEKWSPQSYEEFVAPYEYYCEKRFKA